MAVHHRPILSTWLRDSPPMSPRTSSMDDDHSKTHSFFFSPPPQSTSLNDDFFNTPLRTPSPPPTTKKSSALLNAIHPSRIFPSRYTSRHDHKEEFVGLSLMPSPQPHQPRVLSSLSSLSVSSSSESTHSALPEASSTQRLPTPPPSTPLLSQNEPTPRAPPSEPSFTSNPTFLPEFDVEPEPGAVVTNNPPRISHPSPSLIISPEPDSTFHASLHLIRPLGQGAFSSVWLAQDQSPISLTLKSKKNVRELRKKASIASLSRRSSVSSRKSSLRSVASGSRGNEDPSTLARYGSHGMRTLRARVKGTRPVGFNTAFVDERHGEMGTASSTTAARSSVGVFSSSDEKDYGYSLSIVTSPPISASNSMSSDGGGAAYGVTSEGGFQLQRKKSKKARLVAVKLTPRRATGLWSVRGKEEGEEERTRVGFVREVEILKHISHPNITVLLEHMSTPSYHILVLPYLPGGDLLGLVNNDIAWSKLGESVLRRIWCELCRAVGWMHGVGLVHRDIKLENILLTNQSFASLTTSSPRPTLATLPQPPTPLIKLTDFGLSRFIHVDESTGEGELLWTRCGSEAYAAPELVMGSGSVRAQQQSQQSQQSSAESVAKWRRRRRVSAATDAASAGVGPDGEETEQVVTKGFYDARETDAWACGVVLYALVGRRLPFGEGVAVGCDATADAAGSGVSGKEPTGRIGGDGTPGYGHGRGSAVERRHWLMKIARGEYEWPCPSSSQTTIDLMPPSPMTPSDADDDALVGEQLVRSEGAKRVVGKLLVRDARKRARVMDLWEDEWMWGPGGGLAVGMTESEWREREQERQREWDNCSHDNSLGLGIDFGEEVNSDEGGEIPVGDMDVDERNFVDEGFGEDDVAEEGGGYNVEGGDFDADAEEEGEVLENEEGEEGWLLDQEGIGSVARQEVA